MLELISSPSDLKNLNIDSLPTLCQEVREKIINIVKKNLSNINNVRGILCFLEQMGIEV